MVVSITPRYAVSWAERREEERSIHLLVIVVIIGHFLVIDGLDGPGVHLIAQRLGHELVLPLGLLRDPAQLQLERVSHFVVQHVEAVVHNSVSLSLSDQAPRKNVHLGHVFHGLTTRHVEELVLLNFRLGGLLALANGAAAVALHQTSHSVNQHTSQGGRCRADVRRSHPRAPPCAAMPSSRRRRSQRS